MILYRILSGNIAITTAEYANLVAKPRLWSPNMSGEMWGNRSDEVKELITAMLNWNPTARPSAKDCLSHKWFGGLCTMTVVTEKVIKRCLRRMREVQEKRPLRDALKGYLLHKAPPDLPLLISVFTAINKNCDGRLTHSDLKSALALLLPSDQTHSEASRLLTTLDRANTGSIEYTDFLIAACNEKKLLLQTVLIKTFTSLDREKRGKVSFDSLQHLFLLSPERERGKLWGEIVKLAIKITPNDLDFHDFRKLMVQVITGK